MKVNYIHKLERVFCWTLYNKIVLTVKALVFVMSPSSAIILDIDDNSAS